MKGTLVVAGRVLRSLAGDRSTAAFVIGAPLLILFLFGEVLDEVGGGVDAAVVKPALMGIFVFTFTYALTGVGFLRERQNGTLERILAGPLPRTSLVTGYLLGYGLAALVQASVILGAGVWFVDITFEHNVGAFYAVELMAALTALGLGILVSTLARSEFQVVQFIPLLIAPQIILGGVFVSVERLPVYLEVVARVMPLTYILEAMNYLVLDRGGLEDLWVAFLVLTGMTLAALGGAVLTLRRPA